MRWGNAVIKEIKRENDVVVSMKAELLPDDKDFKQTKKLTWISKDSPLVKLVIVEIDHLIKVKKIEEDMNFEDIVNDNTWFETECYADANIKNSKEGDVFQLERRGFYRVDKIKN